MSLSISKRSASAPPVIAKVTESPASASVAARTTTFWTFSAMVGVALDVKAGSSSLTSWTVTVTVIVSSADAGERRRRPDDGDDDDAGVGVVAGAAAGRLEVRGAVERQDAAVGDAEQVVVDAGGVGVGVTME